MSPVVTCALNIEGWIMKRVYFILLVVFLSLFLMYVHINTSKNELIFFKGESREIRKKKLEEDLEYFENVMLKKYQREHRNISDDNFKKEINNLRLKLDNLTDNEFVVEIQRIMSMFREGHLSFNILNQALLPFESKVFDDGIYIIRTEKEYEKYIYYKILAINDIDINTILKKIENIVSGDSSKCLKYGVDKYINNVDYLLGLGIVKNINNVKLSIEKNGEVIDVVFKTKINRDIEVKKEVFSEIEDYNNIKLKMKQKVLDIFENLDDEKLKKYNLNLEQLLNEIEKFDYISYYTTSGVFLKLGDIPYNLDRNKAYDFKFFPESDAVVFQYNKCEDEEIENLKSFSKKFFDYIESNKKIFRIKNIIVDLRYNSGGSSLVILPFLIDLENYLKMNQDIRLSVIIGRNTFSAGADAFYQFKTKFKNVKSYGEELSGGIYASGDITTDILPNSKLIFSYGQRFINSIDKRFFTKKEIFENVISPDIFIKQTILDYEKNKDFVLEKILKLIKN